MPLIALRRQQQDALWFHALFFALAVPLAWMLRGSALGWLLLTAALTYNLALPTIGRWRQHGQWLRLWQFLLPLSFTLPLADWVLVDSVGVLVFPDHGSPRIGGAVPIYFMGLWIMLLWPLITLACATARPYACIAVTGLLAFVLWEWAARPLNLWHAHDVRSVHGFALYVLPAELLLCLAALFAYRYSQAKSRAVQIVAALAVTPFYSGALVISHRFLG